MLAVRLTPRYGMEVELHENEKLFLTCSSREVGILTFKAIDFAMFTWRLKIFPKSLRRSRIFGVEMRGEVIKKEKVFRK